MKRLFELYRQAFQFITVDIWNLRNTRIGARDLWLIKLLKIIFISFRGFFIDKVSLRASALTYYTLIALVPVVAMFIGIAKGFGLHQHLIETLKNNFAEQEQVLEFLLKFADSTLNKASGGWITGISALFLLWAILSLLNNIEISFNHIWQIKHNRPWSRKVTDYLSVMLIAPLFLIVSSSITVALHSRVISSFTEWGLYSYTAPLIKIGFKTLSYALLWLVFTFVYVALPYTKVKFKSALLAGIVAGTLFLLTQNFYIYSQVMVSKYSAIYGSFAAFPLFLLWAQISWLILLFGAELSFAAQNVERYEFGVDPQHLSMHNRKLLALLVSHLVIKNFAQGKEPLSSAEIADTLGTPVRLIREVLYVLTECSIVRETVTNDPKVNAYMPSLDIHLITVEYVLDKLELQGKLDLEAGSGSAPKRFTELLHQMSLCAKQGGGSTKLMDI
jgi:membrane protein